MSQRQKIAAITVATLIILIVWVTPMAYSWVKEIGYPADLPFKEVLLERINSGAGKTSVECPVVPAGEVWEINQVFLHVDNSGTLNLKVLIDILGTSYGVIFDQKDTATWMSWSGKIFLTEGKKLYGTNSVATSLFLRVWGIKRLSLENALASQKLRIDLILPSEVDVQEPGAVNDPPM